MSGGGFYGNPVGLGGEAQWQAHIPAPLAVIHGHHHAGDSGRMIHGLIHEKEIRPHLQNRQGKTIDQQPHGDAGGMAAAPR